MAWNPPRTWNPGETVTASLMNAHVRDNLNFLKSAVAAAETISRGGVLVNTNGITAGVIIIVWRAPYTCTVTNVRGYRVAGTGATINARRQGASTHLAANLSLTSANTWMDGGAVQDTAYVVGDKMEIMIQTVAGSPTEVAVQIDLSVP